MKKPIFIIVIAAIILFIGAGEKRNFYCLKDAGCVTVWKTYGKVCYIIPGKYYGILKPANDFIETANDNNITVFFAPEITNGLIFRSDHNVKVYNGIKKHTLLNYNQDKKKYERMLYSKNARNNADTKGGVNLIDIFIRENFALDKNGQLL
ncbi:hypothetical protein ACVW0P_002598 [Mucilaginibacter sp. UYNi724]